MLITAYKKKMPASAHLEHTTCICQMRKSAQQHIHLRANSIFIVDTHTSICSVGYKFLSLTFFFRKLKVGCLGLLVMAG